MAEAELTTVARPYARAAFGFALDRPDGLAKWSRMLSLLGAAAETDVVEQALDNPQLTTGQEVDFLASLMAEDLTPEGRNFLSVLAENGRLSLLPHISDLFEDLKAQHEKTLDVKVTSAFEVSDEDKRKLGDALRNRLQKEVELTAVVDETLLGGVVIRTEDTVIDNSLRGRLEKLARVLS